MYFFVIHGCEFEGLDFISASMHLYVKWEWAMSVCGIHCCIPIISALCYKDLMYMFEPLLKNNSEILKKHQKGTVLYNVNHRQISFCLTLD